MGMRARAQQVNLLTIKCLNSLMTALQPTFVAESVCTPDADNVALVPIARPMPCVLIFLNGDNSEGGWSKNAEDGLVEGLDIRRGRGDVESNQYARSDGRSNVGPNSRKLRCITTNIKWHPHLWTRQLTST
jgi:hypothetical protein